MKYKIFLIILIGTILTILIYNKETPSKQKVLALGDGISTGMMLYHLESYNYNDYLVEYLRDTNNLDTYFKTFNESNETTTSLLNKINNNIKSLENNTRLKQAIKNASIITISLGMDELNNYALNNTLTTPKINEFLNQYNEILKNLRNLNKNPIYLISLYPSNYISLAKITKINEKLNNLANTYNITYIDITDITNNQSFFITKNNYYLNYKGQKYIFAKIKQAIIDIEII